MGGMGGAGRLPRLHHKDRPGTRGSEPLASGRSTHIKQIRGPRAQPAQSAFRQSDPKA